MLLRDIASQFGIAAVHVRRIPRGWVNTSWQVTDQGGNWFVLKRVTPERTLPELVHEHRVLAVLGANEWIVPRPLRAKDGSTIVEADGYRWWLAHWIPGRSPSPHSPTYGRRAGALLARLHGVTALASIEEPTRTRLRDVARWPFHEDGHTLAAALTSDDSLTRDLRTRLRRAVDEVEEQLQSITGSPEVLTHFDFHHHNLREFRGQTGVLDFDFAHHDERVADIATALHFLPNAVVATAFLDGYDAAAPLTPDERRAIPFFYDARKLLHGAWLTTHPPGQDVPAELERVLRELGSCPLR